MSALHATQINNYINTPFVSDSCTCGIITVEHMLIILINNTIPTKVAELCLLMLDDFLSTYTDNPGVTLCWFFVRFEYASQPIHLL